LLDACTEKGVPQCDAAFIAARRIDNLTARYGTMGFYPVAPPPTVGGGEVRDLLAVSM